MRKKKVLPLMLVTALSVSVVLSACSTQSPTVDSGTAAKDAGQDAKETSKETAKPKEVTVSGWVQYTPPPVDNVKSYNDNLVWKEIPKRTGVTVNWETTTDDYKKQLGLIMASGKLPDLIGKIDPLLANQYGRQGALKPLEELIKKNAPTLQKILDDNPRIKGQITSPDGHIYFFPRLLFDPRTQTYAGFMIRGDWLEKLGMKVPETTDELYTVLKAFKDKDPNGNGKADEVPFTADPRPLIWAFGVGSRGNASQDDFFVEDGKVKLGPVDPRFKDALMYLNKLYAEGLLDREYEGQKNDQRDARVMQELSGFMFGSNAGYLTRFNKMLAAGGKKEGFIAMAPPKGPTGERNIIGRHTEIDRGVGVAITSSAKNADEITKMMDYFYTKEGTLLLNFGLEGDTYTMKNGVPTYTDKVAKHATLDVLNYLNAYVGNVSTWASINMPESYLATLSEEARKGNDLAVKNAGNKKVPALHFTPEETAEVQNLHRDIDTYIDENVNAFITGKKPFSDYETYLQGLKKIGSDRLVDHYNKAYERFLKVAKSK
jgi:putative aldouronate transport system substrate-binding protein